MSDRAIKYGLMFIALTFVTVGLTELLTGRRVHPVQYLLVGLALSLFFLLLLSLSEHLPFLVAYLIAAGAAAAVLTQYAAAMLGGWLRGLAFGGGIALLYGALYVLLSREQTALVIGAVLLFAVLAGVMTLTRKLDWYRLGGERDAAAE
jgi:inner membrane protein